MDAVRKFIEREIRQRGTNMKAVSKELGLNETYVQQFLKSGKPKVLPEDVRLRLAELWGVDETALGAPARKHIREEAAPESLVFIPEHDVRLSAGGGAVVPDDPEVGNKWPFPKAYLRHALSLTHSDSLAVSEVIGDSMEPTLRSGDRVMVDMADQSLATPGVFALHDGDGTVIKRVERVPASRPPSLRLISDNPHHGNYEVPAETVHVVGRVVWFGRRL